MKQEEIPRLGQNIMTEDHIKMIAAYESLHKKHRPTQEKILSFWIEEMEKAINNLKALSGDSFDVVIEKLTQTDMHPTEVAKYYAKYGDYPK